MKVLCLHGRGTSGAIFRSQTAALRAKLDLSFTFDFPDGPCPCPPAPGTEVLFGTGSFCWWPKEDAEAIRTAHRWLDEYIAGHGPYDAAMGFSQGCQLIGSYLMCRGQIETTIGAQPPPFHTAIFVCGGLSPIFLDEVLGLPVPAKAHDIDARSAAVLRQKAGRLRELAAHPDQIQRGVGLWDDTDDLLHEVGGALPADDDVFGLDFTTFPAGVFIDIPTVHVYGSKDPRLPGAIQLAYFCRNRVLYDHGGGHEIPRSSSVSLRIAGLLKQLARNMES